METNPFRLRREAGTEPEAADVDGPGTGVHRARPGPRSRPGDRSRTPPQRGPWARFVERVRRDVSGHRWWARAPLWLVLAWFFRGYLVEPDHRTILWGITLGVHEMGHAFFSWTGHRILTAAGGTLFQLAVPLGAAVYLFVRQRDPFGATVGLFWLGDALVAAGRYAADARAQALPLVSPFGPVDVDSHDWTVMLMKFGRLSRDEIIGGRLTAAGMGVMLGSLVAGAAILWMMGRTGARAPG